MKLDEAVEFLMDKQSYLDWGDKRVADHLDISERKAEQAKTLAKNRLRSNKDNKGSYRDYDKKENHGNTNENRGYDKPTAKQDQSLEEYCRSIGLDPEKIDPYNDVKYWTDAAGNRRYSIVPKKLRDTNFDPVEAFRESIEEYRPRDHVSIFKKIEEPNDRIAFIDLFDAHLDKVCYVEDTEEDVTIEDNIETFTYAFNELLSSVADKLPEKIVIPVGNDFWHTNDASLETKNGTDMSDRVHVSDKKAFKIGLNLIRECIDKARSVADVEIVPIPGNHDADRVFYLTECLLMAYENQSDVTVRESRRKRKYIRYGEWLFGLAHGEQRPEEYPSLMMTDEEGKKHWSDISRAVYMLGDKHHQKKYNYIKSKDFRGCEVKFLRSIGSTDKWHFDQGYTGIPKTAYGFVFDKDGSRDYEFKVNI